MNGNCDDSHEGRFEARDMLGLRGLHPALFRRSTMLHLTPPKTVTFLISIVLAAIAASIHYAQVPIPYTHSGFSILFAGYAALLAGNLLEGV
jgi:hypothetical protein